MPKADIFLDSSTLIAGILSSQGASCTLLHLGEDEKIILMVPEQVIAEVERNIARKAPKALPFAREIILRANIRIVRNPTLEKVREHLDWISRSADVPILVADREAEIDFLATLSTRHFTQTPEVSQRSGLRIDTPADALLWVQGQLTRSIK